MNRTLLTLAAIMGLMFSGHAQHQDLERPAAWDDLVHGGRFMDRFEPMPLLGPRTSDTWGTDAVKPRDILNGIEEAEWSYWGGNITRASDGAFHLFVCRWPENHPKGHMGWHESEVVRCTSRERMGPYRVEQRLGKGHNPEVFQLQDGRYVCYVMNAFYLGETLEGPWERGAFTFDPRDRAIVEGLSNLSFARREDGSFLMVCRGGGIWVSRDGLSPWEQVTQGSNYPKVQGRFEDPVLWRTAVQYHLIVNDWHGRIAYHLRSKNGVHWKTDSGEAYLPGIAESEDGKREDWYKYERIKVFQDEHRRAVQANFAVIDHSKWEDQPNDIHSSKNISIPLTPGRLITLLHPEQITDDTHELRVRISAEPGFDPHQDIAWDSLRFGAPEEVDFGRGAPRVRTVKHGKDLDVIFSGKGTGFADHNFAAKMLGRTTDGKLLFGYCRLPWIAYDEPILTVRRPQIVGTGKTRKLRIEVSNHGQACSEPSALRLTASPTRPEPPPIKIACPAIEPYEKTVVEVPLPSSWDTGKPLDLQIATGLSSQQPTRFSAKAVQTRTGFPAP